MQRIPAAVVGMATSTFSYTPSCRTVFQNNRGWSGGLQPWQFRCCFHFGRSDSHGKLYGSHPGLDSLAVSSKQQDLMHEHPRAMRPLAFPFSPSWASSRTSHLLSLGPACYKHPCQSPSRCSTPALPCLLRQRLTSRHPPEIIHPHEPESNHACLTDHLHLHGILVPLEPSISQSLGCSISDVLVILIMACFTDSPHPPPQG